MNWDGMRENEMAKLFSACREIERRSEEFIWNYKPTPKQLEAHKSDAKIVQMIGGNQSGKTFWLLMELAWHATRTHPYKKNKPSGIIWLVGLDKVNMLETILLPRVLSVIPERLILRWNQKTQTLELTTGWKVVFKSSASGVSVFQSEAVDLILHDEEQKEDIFNECLARTLATDGQILIAMTPTNGMSWSFGRLYKPGKETGFIESTTSQGEIKTKVDIFEMSTYDNPYLSKDSIMQVESLIEDESEREMRMSGKYITLGDSNVFIGLQDKISKQVQEPIFYGDILISENSNRMIEMPKKQAPLFVWENAERGRVYFIGVDMSEGMKKSDNTCISVWRGNKDEFVQVAEFACIIPPEDVPDVVAALGQHYNMAMVNIERNSAGLSAITALLTKYPKMMRKETQAGSLSVGHASGNYGTHTDRNTKQLVITQARELISADKLLIRSENLASECGAFVRKLNGSTGASFGNDDRVMAMLMAVRAYTSKQAKIHPMQKQPEQKQVFYGDVYARNRSSYFNY